MAPLVSVLIYACFAQAFLDRAFQRGEQGGSG
jgi:hypothetical protein